MNLVETPEKEDQVPVVPRRAARLPLPGKVEHRMGPRCGTVSVCGMDVTPC